MPAPATMRSEIWESAHPVLVPQRLTKMGWPALAAVPQPVDGAANRHCAQNRDDAGDRHQNTGQRIRGAGLHRPPAPGQLRWPRSPRRTTEQVHTPARADLAVLWSTRSQEGEGPERTVKVPGGIGCHHTMGPVPQGWPGFADHFPLTGQQSSEQAQQLRARGGRCRRSGQTAPPS